MKTETLLKNLDCWIEEQRLQELSLNTLKQYRNAVNKFINYLQENNIQNIDKNIMLDYKRNMDLKSKSANTKNAWIVGLNKYLKYLDHKDLCLKQIKMQNRYFNYDNMSYSDYKRLLRYAKKLNMIQDYYIIKTLCMTGIRISELQFFTVENLKIHNDNVLKISNKGKERDIPLRNDLARELRKYCREHKIKEGYIFSSPKIKGKMINISTIHKHLKKIAGYAKVKLKVVHAHSFRHLFADIFLETYPENIIILADFLGHSSLETTRIYTRKTVSQKRTMLENLKFNKRDDYKR